MVRFGTGNRGLEPLKTVLRVRCIMQIIHLAKTQCVYMFLFVKNWQMFWRQNQKYAHYLILATSVYI